MKWISVEERLPELDTEVLCFMDECIEVGKLVDRRAFEERNSVCLNPIWHFCDCIDDLGVTHWMPLPEPPKGDE